MEDGSDRDQKAEIPLGDGMDCWFPMEGLFLEASLHESESEMKMFFMQRTMSSDRRFGFALPKLFTENCLCNFGAES